MFPGHQTPIQQACEHDLFVWRELGICICDAVIEEYGESIRSYDSHRCEIAKLFAKYLMKDLYSWKCKPIECHSAKDYHDCPQTLNSYQFILNDQPKYLYNLRVANVKNRMFDKWHQNIDYYDIKCSRMPFNDEHIFYDKKEYLNIFDLVTNDMSKIQDFLETSSPLKRVAGILLYRPCNIFRNGK